MRGLVGEESQSGGRGPGPVRAIGGFYLLGAGLGVVTSLVEFLQGGMISIGLPLGLGISGWAIGRGLLRGDRRAWRWARRIAAVAPVLIVTGVALMLVFPEHAQISSPLGGRAVRPWDPWVLAGGSGAAVFFGWQFLVLGSPSARRFFQPAEPTRRIEDVDAREGPEVS